MYHRYTVYIYKFTVDLAQMKVHDGKCNHVAIINFVCCYYLSTVPACMVCMENLSIFEKCETTASKYRVTLSSQYNIHSMYVYVPLVQTV